jgi:hypothetical protein
MMQEVLWELSEEFNSMPPRIYKTDELCLLFQVKSRATIIRWIKSGMLKGAKVGRDYLVLEKDLVLFLKSKGLGLEDLQDGQMEMEFPETKQTKT